MDIGPTVILATSFTTAANPIQPSMTMGSISSTMVGQKPTVEPMLNPCDLNKKQKWLNVSPSPASSMHYLRHPPYHHHHHHHHVLIARQANMQSSELHNSRHSTSDAQFRNHYTPNLDRPSELSAEKVYSTCVNSHQPKVLLSLQRTSHCSCNYDQSKDDFFNHVTISTPCDLPVSSLCSHSQGTQLKARSCLGTQTAYPMIQTCHAHPQRPLPTALISLHAQPNSTAPCQKSDGDEYSIQAKFSQIAAFDNGNNNPPSESTHPAVTQKEWNQLYSADVTSETHGNNNKQPASRSNCSSSHSMCEIKMVSSSQETGRCQVESAVSEHRKTTSSTDLDTLSDQLNETPQQPQNQRDSVIQSTADCPYNRSKETRDILSEEPINSTPSSTVTVPESSFVFPKRQSVSNGSTDEKYHVERKGTNDPLNRRSLVANSPSVVVSDPRSRTCCFCWCCCCSCSCMRVRANIHDSKRPSASNDPQSRLIEISMDEKLTYEEVKSWADAFDLLMQSPAGRRVFREFLRSEYSEENIMFWLACEELKQETNPELIEEKARMIYEDFISILSPREVSLDSRVRELINANMIEPTPRTFDEAQLQIYTLMHRDSYLRFLNSRIYRDLLQQTSHTLSNTSLK